MDSKPLSGPGKFLLSILALLVAGGLILAALIGWGIKYYNAPGQNTESVTVIIPKGTGFEGVTKLLYEGGVIEHPLAFSAITIVTDKARLIKAGEYAFPEQVPPKDVLASLVEGKTVIHKLTVPEGYSTAQILDMVGQEDKLAGDVPSDIQEGELLPETYYFSRGDSRPELVARMKRDMRALLMELWEKRRSDLPFRTPQEALALASIVEKETGIDSEYATVASVYINRLKKGMLLQADPTVIYALTQGKKPLGRPLKLSDLRMESPYNTYVTPGLPPGPIANPGRRALEAVFNPADTDYIFFVATGSGGHNFSRTLDQHNAYVSQFRSLLKDQKEKSMKEADKPKMDPVPAAVAPPTEAPFDPVPGTEQAPATN